MFIYMNKVLFCSVLDNSFIFCSHFFFLRFLSQLIWKSMHTNNENKCSAGLQ